jgi:hypothetical protein
MKAYLKHHFSKGFLLSEENVIKLNDIISKRIQEKNYEEDLLYKVYRSDALVYESKDHEKILREENSRRNQIIKLEVRFQNKDFKFELAFDKNQKANLEIESSDKDFAYLLFSDIKEYLNTEVLRFRSYDFTSSRIERYMLLFIPIIMAFSLLVSVDQPRLSDADFNELLNSDSVTAKLNQILQEHRSRSMFARDWIWFVIVLVVGIGATFITNLLDKMYPMNIFYFGKELARFDRLRSLRAKILWGIVIAFIVSALSGLLVWQFTKH